MVGKAYEHGGIAKDGAKLVMAVACAQVPKLTVVIGGSYGAGNYGMCGRAFGPRLLFMWPNARISVMGARQAAETLLTVRLDALRARGEEMDEAAREAFVQPIVERYEQESDASYSTRPPVGRRRDRPARHAPRARARPGRRGARADPRAALRRLPDVSGLARRARRRRRAGVARPARAAQRVRRRADRGACTRRSRRSPRTRRCARSCWPGAAPRSAPAPISSGCAPRASFTHERNVADAERAAAMFAAVDSCPVPVIARVHGAALGGGTGLACCCDIVLAREDARFGFTEVRLGLIPATIAPVRARAHRPLAGARALPHGRAVRRRARAARSASCTRCTPTTRRSTRAVERTLAGVLRGGPAAVRAAKALIAGLRDGDPAPQSARAAEALAERRASDGGPRGHRRVPRAPGAALVSPPFECVAVACRGEIALRVIRACRELGVRSLALVAADERGGDRRARGRRGGRGPVLSRRRHARRHGGRAAARRRCTPATASSRSRPSSPRPAAPPASCSSGPPAEALATLGRKDAARELAQRAGVPVVPGGADADERRLSAARQGARGRRRARHARRARRLPSWRPPSRRPRARPRRRSATAACSTSATSRAPVTSRCRSCATRTARACTSASATARCSAATRR